MERIWTTVVPDRWDGKRAGVYLRRELGLSAGLLARVKRTPGGLLRNGLPLRSDEILRRGDTVSVLLEREGARSEAISPEPGELSILFEDQDLLIVDKPAGLPVHQPAGRPGPSLGSIVLAHYGAEGQSFVFRPVHRLDRGTSGVMVIAKNPYVQEKLKGQMHTGDFQREYLALVMGTPDPPEGIIRAPIGRKDGSVLLREVREDGSPAVTRYETILTGEKFTLLHLILETGRTHQIRVHLNYLGHPVLGDFLYGTEEPEILSRPALHSSVLSLRHPMTGARLRLEAPLPADMEHFLTGMEPV
ncbi:RluA family pseudouridine synthase [Papillibacter cinnamivorans]|uniref:Pseudouridine synthase n=1 Tax=Papillibacter cinnamivorans DSM 12816 TaxID=1122930 RepID=A0A1W2A743_9FIRM|nr:RluA family pseudouridine synthase [Papillibacter cinnamivorans]SMC56241.1 23S rRNA pseudouridine1911/1915/1917 synthase [Papillibacter cinnamivorans DSM 12816]